MVMGNSGFVQKKSLIRFHDDLAWLMTGCSRKCERNGSAMKKIPHQVPRR